MARFITLKPRKFFVEFRDSQQASVHGGPLAVAALLEEFGLAERIQREPALDPRGDGGALPTLPKRSKHPTDDDQRPFPDPEQAPTKVGKDSGLPTAGPGTV